MGVYIKGMDMPKCCSECLFRSEFFTDETYGIAYGCNLNISIICHDEYKERKDDCPLVDVPTPHGRLIDADALIEDLERQCKEVFRIDAVSPDDYWITRNEAYNEALWKSWVESFGEYLKTRPTIIKVEEK